MNIAPFLEAIKNRRPRVIAVYASESEAREALGGRVAVSLGAGFPRDSSITGVELNKGPEDDSLCRVVALQAPTMLAQPPLEVLTGRSPADVLDAMVFFVKDASPDSLLAALLLVAHLAGVADAIACFEPWLDSATNWDQGYMPEQPFRSWPALASALSHARFPAPSAQGSTTAAGLSSFSFQLAWDRSFAFLIQSLMAGAKPEEMPQTLHWAGSPATIALRRLQQVYEHTLTHATMLQLSVPLTDAPGRRVMVDALVYVEDEPSDAVKVFGRMDARRASGGRGFRLAAAYRPTAADWNRFTIHADPTEGLDLTALWVELERRETEAYRQRDSGLIARTADKAAPSEAEFVAGKVDGLSFLPKGVIGPNSFESRDLDRLSDKSGKARVLATVNNIWRNPWFLFKDASLIGSPGKDERNAVAGPTLLNWEQVVDSLWVVFNPLSGIRVEALRGPEEGTPPIEVNLLEAPAMDLGLAKSGPIFRYLDWPKGAAKSTQTRGIVLDDLNTRIIAALAEQPARPAPITLSNLPPRAECRLVSLSGGFAVVSNGGCVVVDDWHDMRLGASEMVKALRRAGKWKAELDGHVEDLTRFNDKMPSLTRGDSQPGNAYTLIGEVALARSRLASLRVIAASSLNDANARLLDQELKSFWGLAEREAYVAQGYDQIETSVKALQDARSARLLKYLGIYGFPAFISVNFSKPLANFINAYCVSRGWVWLTKPSPLYDALGMVGEAVSWLACTALLAWLLSWLYRKWDPTLVPRRHSGGGETGGP
ncbi:hypothetical protein KNO81_19930 [Paraburkholderia sediminicola]|nr:hypothetical protein [Paraburkholderia sediminicola]